MMSGRFTSKDHMWAVSLCWLCLAMVFIITGCGDDDDPEENTKPDALESGVVFSIQWQIPASTSPDADTTIGDCATAGVVNVTAYVYDEDDTVVATSGPWPCQQGRFEIHDVPPGVQRSVAVLGWNANDEQIVYRGNTDAATEVVAEKMADVGAIDAHAFIPVGLEAEAVTETQIDLTWNDMAREEMGPVQYRVYRNGEEIATIDSPNHADTGLTAGTEYCYTVAVSDIHDNLSGLSDPSCVATTGQTDEQAPSVPTEVTAEAVSASQVNLSWAAATDDEGVTGYRIFRNDSAVGTSETTTFSDTGLTGETQYCYSITAYDAAENESNRSTEEICATTQPNANWYRDEDGDGYGDPAQVVDSAEQPEGYVSDNTDCDDTVAEINPGVEETPYNGVNDDCDFDTPDDDLDNDGYVHEEDCDDQDPDVNPRTEEVIDNGKDDDCDPDTPDSSLDIDNDGDGFTENEGDCRDQVPTIHPDAVEVCNEIDDNCDETVDEDCLIPIDVNIDDDFEYVESNFAPMGIDKGPTMLADRLGDRPLEILSEPNYDFRYGQGNYTIQYSYLRLGNAADQRISFALIHVPNQNRYEYIVDTDNDENLWQEDYIRAQGLSRITAYATVNIDIRNDAGELITRPYRVHLEKLFTDTVRFESKCHYINQSFGIGDDTFTAIAMETHAYNGLYRTSGLFIDLNGDEEIDYDTEHYADQSVITLDNVGYLLRLNYP